MSWWNQYWCVERWGAKSHSIWEGLQLVCVGIFKTFHWNSVGILETSLLILLELCSIFWIFFKNSLRNIWLYTTSAHHLWSREITIATIIINSHQVAQNDDDDDHDHCYKSSSLSLRYQTGWQSPSLHNILLPSPSHLSLTRWGGWWWGYQWNKLASSKLR